MYLPEYDAIVFWDDKLKSLLRGGHPLREKEDIIMWIRVTGKITIGYAGDSPFEVSVNEDGVPMVTRGYITFAPVRIDHRADGIMYHYGKQTPVRAVFVTKRGGDWWVSFPPNPRKSYL